MATASPEKNDKKPICLIVLGMAGSGKTSLVTRLTNSENKPYVVNLDPACINLPYFANIGMLKIGIFIKILVTIECS